MRRRCGGCDLASSPRPIGGAVRVSVQDRPLLTLHVRSKLAPEQYCKVMLGVWSVMKTSLYKEASAVRHGGSVAASGEGC